MIKIGYWGIKARGEIPKTVATYVGIPFEEVDYMQPEKWFGDDKINLGLDFPNIPYLIDGNVKVTEASAICVYLALKAGQPELLGVGATNQAHVRMICNALEEAFGATLATASKPDGKESLAGIKDDHPAMVKFAQAEQFLGNKDWFLGEITLPDIIGSYIIWLVDYFIRCAGGQTIFNKFPKLGALVKRFNALPHIKARLESEAYRNKPVFMPGRLPFDMLPN